MRTRSFSSALLLLASLALVGAGCGQGASVATNGTPTEKPSTTTSDSCGNPYYGFKPGLTIAYSVTPFQKVAGDSDYTTSILSSNGLTVTARTEMAGGIASTMSINCLDHSVASTDGQDFQMKVISSSGTFMPPNVKAGSTWNNSQTIEIGSASSSEAAKAAGLGTFTITTTEQSRAAAEESITVKAGTYKAVKVEVTRTSASQFSGSAKSTNPPSASTSVEWWVKGVGMVKSVTMSEGGTSTVEAKSVKGQ